MLQNISVTVLDKPVELQVMTDEVKGFLEWLQTQPRVFWDMYLDAFAVYLRDEYGELAEWDALEWGAVSDQWERSTVRSYAFVDSVNTDILDVTRLEPEESKVLSRTLRYWNGPGPVYRKRYGRRYLDKRIRWIDLEHDVIKALAGYEDLLHACKHEPKYLEPIHLMVA